MFGSLMPTNPVMPCTAAASAELMKHTTSVLFSGCSVSSV
jgi:hypothetical protein